MKNKQSFVNYDFSDYEEITGNALFKINGGGEQVENSHEAVAKAKPGDFIVNSKGEISVLVQGDINFSQNQIGNGGNPGNGNTGSQNNSNQSTEDSHRTGPDSSSDVPENIRNNSQAYAYYMQKQDEAKRDKKDSSKYFNYNVLGQQELKPKDIKESVYGAPTDSRRVTSPKGYREDADPKEHTGIDIGALVAGVKGDNIYSVENGTVRRNGKTDSKSTRLEIWLPNGDTAVYMHGDFLDFKTGDIIEKGQVLGSMSDKGCKGQVHLHFEIRTQGVYTKLASEAPDPLTVLPKDYQLQY